jgi:hypothetical protein
MQSQGLHNGWLLVGFNCYRPKCTHNRNKRLLSATNKCRNVIFLPANLKISCETTKYTDAIEPSTLRHPNRPRLSANQKERHPKSTESSPGHRNEILKDVKAAPFDPNHYQIRSCNTVMYNLFFFHCTNPPTPMPKSCIHLSNRKY